MSKPRRFFPLFVLALLAPLAAARGEEGIASRYPGDVGIEKDPAVVFTEGFEGASLDALKSNWAEVNPARMVLTNTAFPGSPGKRSIFIRGGEGGGITKHYYPGYEKLHRRFYIMYSTNGGKPSHGCAMYGDYPPPQWPIGRAGHRPEGGNRWSASIEPIGDWTWGNYCYWCRMRPFPNGRYWGNVVMPVPTAPVARGEWICVEQMVKMNDPVTATNGEQAVWINGTKVLHEGKGFPKGRWNWGGFEIDPNGEPFEGFLWRTAKELKITSLGFGSWTPHDATLGTWFDHIVIATNYIGPLVPASRGR